MSDLVTDPSDPRLGHGFDPIERGPVPQNKAYLVLSEEERAKGFVRPVRTAYLHKACGTVTTMSKPLAETYARQPTFYGSTYCCACRLHRPLSEFTWDGTQEVVGS